MRGSNISNAGAHTTNYSPLQKGAEIMTTIYRVPAAYVRARAVVTNTAPTRPYRSAGRPEVMYVMERLIDLACREHGFDRVAIRRRNLVKEDEFPYTNALGMIYDSGAYHHTMDWALRSATGRAFRRGAPRRDAHGRYRGIAVANYLDTASGVARERTEMTVRSGRPHRRGDRHGLAGPGPRDDLRPACERMVRACRSRACASSPMTPTS